MNTIDNVNLSMLLYIKTVDLMWRELAGNKNIYIYIIKIFNRRI